MPGPRPACHRPASRLRVRRLRSFFSSATSFTRRSAPLITVARKPGTREPRCERKGFRSPAARRPPLPLKIFCLCLTLPQERAPPTLSSEIRQGGPARGKRVHTFRGWCAPVRSPKESRVFPETWNARQTRCEKKWAAARDGCKRRPQEILFSLADRGVCFAATFHRRATHQQ